MIERLVENWLINSGERHYEVAFAQLLAAEGHVVIQGPVHHPFEHGKDILALAPNNALHAYQLKGPELGNLESFEKIQGQLVALAGTAVTHPAITTPRRPDRVFLVTNSVLTPPVRDRIEKFNFASAQSGWPIIEPIEQEQLLGRFLAAHGKYLPRTLPEVRPLLELYYDDDTSVFPVRSFAQYVTSILPFPPRDSSVPDCRAAVASLALLTAYAASSWTASDNYLGIAQAWLTVCATLLYFAASRQLPEKIWLGSYHLALNSARSALSLLAKEATDHHDLLIPDLVDGLIYPSRALLVCSFLAAHYLSERTLGNAHQSIADLIGQVLRRECRSIRLVGECDVPGYLLTANALEQLGDIRISEAMMLSLVAMLSRNNQRHSPVALADPYHETEQILLQQMGTDSGLEGEEFDGRSYMLHVGVDWLARRLSRRHLAAVWPDVTRVQFVEFQPSSPITYLAVSDKDGKLQMWSAGQPQSWGTLYTSACEFDRNQLPDILWARREMIPYLPLLFPYRLTGTFAKAIDHISHNPDS